MPRGPRSLQISDNLRKQIRSFKGDKKDSAVCDLLGISQQTLTRIMSGRELRLSERVLRRIADVLGTSTGFLTTDPVENTPPPSKLSKSSTDPRRLIGEALLADARGDHQNALDILATLAPPTLDSFAFVAYRLAAARAYCGVGELEKAERLLREAIAHLEEIQGSALLRARCAFELALLLSRREKTFDAIEAFALAERILEKVGNSAAPHLFLVRQYFLGLTMRIGHREHSLRLLRSTLHTAKEVEGDGSEGLWRLEESLFDALDASRSSNSS